MNDIRVEASTARSEVGEFPDPKPIMVFGATGSQGGAVARHLIARGHRVRAATRSPQSPKAQRLAKLGADVVQANLDDPTSVFRAVQGSRGVFAVTDWVSHGVAKEIEHGKTMASAALGAGVPHFVLSSGASCDAPGGAPQMASKWQVEQFAHSLGLPMTVLRPALFMEDLHDPKYSPRVGWALMNTIIGMDRVLPWVAVDDVGAVAALAFDQRDQFVGRTLPLTGDCLSLRQCFYLFKNTQGQFPALINLPVCLVRKFLPDLISLWEWLRDNDMEGSPSDMRTLLPGTLDMQTWLLKRVQPIRSVEGSPI